MKPAEIRAWAAAKRRSFVGLLIGTAAGVVLVGIFLSDGPLDDCDEQPIADKVPDGRTDLSVTNNIAAPAAETSPAISK